MNNPAWLSWYSKKLSASVYFSGRLSKISNTHKYCTGLPRGSTKTQGIRAGFNRLESRQVNHHVRSHMPSESALQTATNW